MCTLRSAVMACAGMLSTAPAYADNACAPVLALIDKLNATKEYRALSTYIETKFQHPGTEEGIFFQWKYYFRWNGGPWTVQRRVPNDHNVWDCQRHADEIIDGIPTITMRYMREYRGDLLRLRTNISKLTGLPVRIRYSFLGPGIYDFWTTKFDYTGPFVDPVLRSQSE